MNTLGTMSAGLPVVNSALSLPSPGHLCTVEKKSRIVFPVGFPAELARGEVQSVRYLHEKVRYTPKELCDFSNFYRQKSGRYAWEWILKV